MKTERLISALIFAFLIASSTFAAPFNVSWWTVDGGGATGLSGGAFTLGGTAGQPETIAMTGGPYALTGGFWTATLPSKNVARNWIFYE